MHRVFAADDHYSDGPLVRVAAVDFLNTLPLVAEFLDGRGPRGYLLERASPAACAARLARGEADIALIPSVEYARIPGLLALPEICIAAEREVRSVLLLSRRPIGELQRVAVDPGSRTSVALLALLLGRGQRAAPELVPWGGSAERALAEHDAVLLIGDAALRAPRAGLHVLDLASEWTAWTGRPFVFAFWAMRDGVRLPGPVGEFLAAQKRGLQTLDWRVAEAARRAGVGVEDARAYFRHHLHYEFGELECASLHHFYALSAAAGLIPSAPTLRFYRDATGPAAARVAG
jgi:chorismate dehydratase